MSAELIVVEARANVFDLRYGERGTFPVNYPELLEALARGLVVDVTSGVPVERLQEQAPKRRPCGCGH